MGPCSAATCCRRAHGSHGSCAHSGHVPSVPPRPTPYGPRELGRAGGAEGARSCPAERSQHGVLPSPSPRGARRPVLLLAGGPGVTGPSRWAQSGGHGALRQRRLHPQLSGPAEPRGHADGHHTGSVAPGTALHVPVPSLGPAVPRHAVTSSPREEGRQPPPRTPWPGCPPGHIQPRGPGPRPSPRVPPLPARLACYS